MNEDVYTFFFELEVVIRNEDLHAKSRDDILHAIESDEDVMYVWLNIPMEIGDLERKYLFNHFINLYYTIRGHSFSKSIMELYKQHSQKTLQKSKGLRKKINTD